MQQEWLFLPPLELILYETFLAFLVVVSIGFYRFAKGTKLQTWSIGWIAYTMGAVVVAVRQPTDLQLIDLIAIPLAFVGACIIARTSRLKVDSEKDVRIYLLYFLVGVGWVIACFALQIPLCITYMLPGFCMSYACILSAREISKLDIDVMIGVWVTVIGLLMIAFSAVWLPLLLVLPVLDLLMLFQASGIIMVAASMNAVLIRMMRKDLRVKNQIARLMSSVLQHDIRNYLQVFSNALDLVTTDALQSEHWLEVAADTVRRAQSFIDEMREIALSLDEQSLQMSPLRLRTTLDEVIGRAQREYGIKANEISVHVAEDITVLSNRLVNELIWNIIDNAFKHGSHSLVVEAHFPDTKTCVISITDSAGGLPETVKHYLCSPDNSSEPVPFRNGLGIGLIRGLAPLCGVLIQVEDHVSDSEVVGTVFHLEFVHIRR